MILIIITILKVNINEIKINEISKHNKRIMILIIITILKITIKVNSKIIRTRRIMV